MIYHCRKLVEKYTNVAQGISRRIQDTNADVVMMYSPDVQEIMFEFYALVNLARISLDNLRNVLHPVFKQNTDNYLNQFQISHLNQPIVQFI